jgi:putative ABC transport system permease protein
VSVLPLGGDFDTATAGVEGQVYGPGEQPSPERYIVTPDYFKTMQVRLVRGRVFSDADNEPSPLVVLISETAAQRWWPNQDPIGKRMRIAGTSIEQSELWRTVVGVVNDVKQAGLDAPHTIQVYIPHAQYGNDSMILVVRSASDPVNYTSAVRQQISVMDKDLAVSDIASLEQVLSVSVGERRFSTVLLGVFAGLGLLLASVGVYGILSYSVAQRMPEFGIRLALGATRKDVLALVLRQGCRLAILGVAVGGLAALALTRLMSSLLFEISPSDPSTFGGVALVLGAVALVATYVPARRATKVDPMVALRYE